MAALAAIHLGIVQMACADATNATIPYEKLDSFFQISREMDQSKLQVRIYIVSSNRAVHAGDISLTIQSTTKGMIPVAVGTNGEILNFPVQKDLSRENPPVVANQPKGTLQIFLSANVPLPDGLTFHYSHLSDSVAEANRMIDKQAGMMSMLAPRAKGVVLYFPKSSAGKATVTISAITGPQVFTADDKGRIKLKIDDSLTSENPQVQLSEKTLAAQPDIE
jgi:hypothetical protein